MPRSPSGYPGGYGPLARSDQACPGGDLAGRKPRRRTDRGEVLQRIRPDRVRRLRFAPPGRHEPGVIPCRGLRRSRRPRLELTAAHHPTNQVLHQRLWHAGVDPIVGHLVADAIGAPPGEARTGPGAQDDAAVMVGEAEEMVGAQAGLDVFERDVANPPRVPPGVACRRALGGGGPDVVVSKDTPAPARAGRVVLVCSVVAAGTWRGCRCAAPEPIEAWRQRSAGESSPETPMTTRLADRA